MACVLVIDFGTSGCRSAIFNERLEMLCSATEEYPLIILSKDEIEQDAGLWWEAAKRTIKAALAASPVPPSQIRSVSISSQGIAIVPIDKDGRTLCNAISWLDTRAEEESDMLRARYGKQYFYDRTGKILSPTYTLPKLIWFRRHRRALYDAAWKILLPLDFIQLRLCGACVTDHTMASGTMFYDVEKQNWAADLLEQNGLSAEKLPEITWAGSVIGTILPQVADELGLRRDVLIVNGAQDQKCAAVAAGAARNIAAISLGTGSCLSQISSSPVQDPDMRIPFFSYVRQHEWTLEGLISTAGSAYSWFQREMAGGQDFDVLDRAAAGVRCPNSVMFFPNLTGASSPNWGQGSGTFTGLSLSSSTGHLARAVLEGVAYSIRENLEAMAGVCGSAQELRLYGGGSKSPLWCQIIANVTGTRVVRLVSSETALAGAAILAFQPLSVKVPARLPCADSFLPQEEEAVLYEASYRHYEAIRQKFFGE